MKNHYTNYGDELDRKIERLIGEGASYKDILNALPIRHRTLRHRISRMYKKHGFVGQADRGRAIMLAIQGKLVGGSMKSAAHARELLEVRLEEAKWWAHEMYGPSDHAGATGRVANCQDCQRIADLERQLAEI